MWGTMPLFIALQRYAQTEDFPSKIKLPWLMYPAPHGSQRIKIHLLDSLLPFPKKQLDQDQ